MFEALTGSTGIIGTVLSFCATANSFPLQEFSYPTTDSYSSFLTRQFLNALLTACAPTSSITAPAGRPDRHLPRRLPSVRHLPLFGVFRLEKVGKGGGWSDSAALSARGAEKGVLASCPVAPLQCNGR